MIQLPTFHKSTLSNNPPQSRPVLTAPTCTQVENEDSQIHVEKATVPPGLEPKTTSNSLLSYETSVVFSSPRAPETRDSLSTVSISTDVDDRDGIARDIYQEPSQREQVASSSEFESNSGMLISELPDTDSGKRIFC